MGVSSVMFGMHAGRMNPIEVFLAYEVALGYFAMLGVV